MKDLGRSLIRSGLAAAAGEISPWSRVETGEAEAASEIPTGIRRGEGWPTSQIGGRKEGGRERWGILPHESDTVKGVGFGTPDRPTDGLELWAASTALWATWASRPRTGSCKPTRPRGLHVPARVAYPSVFIRHHSTLITHCVDIMVCVLTCIRKEQNKQIACIY